MFCSRSLWITLLPLVAAAMVKSANGHNVADTAIRLVLIDSNTDEIIDDIFDGDVIDVAALGLHRPRFNIEAVLPADTAVGSIVFSWNSADYNTENTAPYFLCGVTKRLGSPKRCFGLDVGHHTVTATVFSESDGGGVAGQQYTVRFEIVQSHCGIPQLGGNGWERATKYPIPVAEAQGGVIGNDLIIVSGFSKAWNLTTTKVFALNVNETDAVWRRMDDLPGIDGNGITHAATAIVASKFFMCGGYVGGNPGPATDLCFVYDHSVEPGSGQWSSSLPKLPDVRAGGGMVYDTNMNALFFSGGAMRPFPDDRHAEDQNDTWMLDLDDLDSGWVTKTDGLLNTNHIAHLTAMDHFGRERHYMMGGQVGEFEKSQNTDKIYEWDPSNESWIERAPMMVTRGHATASTRAIGCGFITAGGTTNEYGKTSDISYYDIPTDTWHSIGNLPSAINTPVCGINGGYLFCESGKPKGSFSFRIPISVPEISD